MPIPVYFKDGTLFASDYIRIVHGGRGDYMELKKEDIVVKLKSHFIQELPKNLPTTESYYYYYLEPIGRTEKVYWQNRKVKYADYKIGLFYIDPKLVNFESKNSLLKDC